MKKIIVIGCPGSGKSTFSRMLRDKTGIPLYHLDMLYWNADRTIAERAVFHQRLAEILRTDAWIIDGNYSATMQLRMQACDTVFFLDYPADICLQGIAERRGKQRSDLPWTETGNEDDPAFIEFVKRFPEQSRPQITGLLDRYADKRRYIFKSRSEADAFIEHLAGLTNQLHGKTEE